MNIIAGSLRGRVIPFVNRKFDAAEATPQKIKGALFSILGEDLRGRSFLDLYSCSGQIGLAEFRECDYLRDHDGDIDPGDGVPQPGSLHVAGDTGVKDTQARRLHASSPAASA